MDQEYLVRRKKYLDTVRTGLLEPAHELLDILSTVTARHPDIPWEGTFLEIEDPDGSIPKDVEYYLLDVVDTMNNQSFVSLDNYNQGEGPEDSATEGDWDDIKNPKALTQEPTRPTAEQEAAWLRRDVLRDIMHLDGGRGTPLAVLCEHTRKLITFIETGEVPE